MTSNMRHSEIAYIVMCIRIQGTPHFLLNRHKKWGDWSLVGGHVEAFEHGSWAKAAAREAQEELPPLQHGRDFLLVPIFSRPLEWGPEPSRSAQNRPTTYRAQFFAMEFLVDPASALSRMHSEHLRFVPQSFLERDLHVAAPVRMLCTRLGGGLTSVPLACPDSVDRTRIPMQFFDPLASETQAHPVSRELH